MKDGGGQIDPSLRPQKKLSLIRVKNPIKFTCKKKKKTRQIFQEHHGYWNSVIIKLSQDICVKVTKINVLWQAKAFDCLLS